ncbi:MAG: transglutaminase-like cysteine peptidase [Candidatus Thiodiazotropha sp.]|nr:transglutaminase-like cysteine peptidase [Candidatus Thiodiazotropha sp.]
MKVFLRLKEHRHGSVLAVLFFTILWLGVAIAFAESIDLTDEVVTWAKQKYGDDAGKRVESWRSLMQDNHDTGEVEKLKLVNDFFNQIPYQSDAILWDQKDYWATPLELLVREGGDCEDYSIAKYFTLKEMGVADEKLRIMYVKSVELNQSHMVLTYYPNPSAIPKVLDNLNPQLLSASSRLDLTPVYSFNADGLWLAKSLGKGKKVGSSKRLSLWQEVKKRMRQEARR